jgi:hypothetical protein
LLRDKQTPFFIRTHNITLAANAAIMVSIVRSIVDTNRSFQFHKRSQLFICVHNETFSVVKARSVSTNRDHSRPAQLPIVIALQSKDFFSRADFAGIHDLDCERLRFRFLTHVRDKLDNQQSRFTAVHARSTRQWRP